jgi:hypothetical protein
MRRFVVIALVLFSAFSLGCASAWKRARSEDTAASYHRFLRENPGSSQADEARERLAFVRIRSKPTLDAYAQFRREFPASPLLADLRAVMEEPSFAQAHAAGTPEAYEDFLREFPDGGFAARARGNAEYLEQSGFGGRLAELAAFAARHPDSDFAAEAQRSAATVAARSTSAFRRIGFELDIAPGTQGADRLERVFRERATRRYEAAGIELVPLAEGNPRAASLPVRLTVRHREEEVRSQLEGGQMSAPGILATTALTLRRSGEDDPIWTHEFTFRASAAEAKPGVSILFSTVTDPYWDQFFIPLATWSTQLAARPPRELGKQAVAIEALGTRAVVLFEDGDFQVFEVGNPAEPLLLTEYVRPERLERWGGVRLMGRRIVLFGEDGLEVVDLSGGVPKRAWKLDRGEVGSIVEVASVGDQLVAAGNRGLLWLDESSGTAHVLVARNVHGLASAGGRVFFTDGDSLFVSTLALLRGQQIEGELRIGRGFGPGRLQLQGQTLVLLGELGVLRFDVTSPTRPRLVSRIEMAEVGRINDASFLGGRLFLLGDRGLQVGDALGERVVDSVDVAARARVGASGRHLVIVGGNTLQVVDATPFVTDSPASSSGP